MSLAAIELNDAAVALARDGELLSESPGFALIEKDALVVGDDARRRARLEPRLVSTRFWCRLSNDAVFPAAPAGATFADLARAHVSRVWTSAGQGADGVILVVPGSFGRRRLGLLLGIAEQLSLPVCGLVDSALAACRSPAGEGLIVHVDVHLHGAVITGIEASDTLRRVFTHDIEGHGLVQLYDGWMKLIADSFVQTTRFDPLHRAQSEQAIYDRLSPWLSTLVAQASMGIEMVARDGGTHVIRLTRDRVVECAREFYVRLAADIGERCGGRPFALQLSHGAARLPGLAAALQPAADGPAVILPAGAGALGALERARAITGGDRHNTLTLSLPRDAFAAHGTIETSR